MYLGVGYITKASQGFYVYSFLNPSEGPILAAYFVGILVGTVIVFCIVNLIKWGLSKRTAPKRRELAREFETRRRDASLEEGKNTASL